MNYPAGAEHLKSAPYNQEEVERWPSDEDFQAAIEDLCDCPEMMALTGPDAMTDEEILSVYKEYRAKVFERAMEND
jgi:hypothetical protein